MKLRARIIGQATLLLLAASLLACKPAGRFEGRWEGQIVINSVENDVNDYYAPLLGKAFSITLDIDEQTATYGHMRIRSETSDIYNDVVRLQFAKGVLQSDDEFLELRAELDGKGEPGSILAAPIRIKKPKSGAVLIGTIELQKTSSEQQIFGQE